MDGSGGFSRCKTLGAARRSLLACVLCSTPAVAVAADAAPVYRDARLTVRLSPRTPQQMAAFYEARGFPRTMVDRLSAQCFITVLIGNTGPDIVWLDLANWTFRNADGRVERRDRVYWRQQWQALRIPLAHQSTFRWTLLPERLDFRPGEHEGGNIVLPHSDAPLRIAARFDVGADRKGEPILVEFDAVRCAEDK